MTRPCVVCGQASEAMIPDGRVCRDHAIEFYTELVKFAGEQARAITEQAGLAQDRAPGMPSSSWADQHNPEVGQGGAVHPASAPGPRPRRAYVKRHPKWTPFKSFKGVYQGTVAA